VLGGQRKHDVRYWVGISVGVIGFFCTDLEIFFEGKCSFVCMAVLRVGG